MTSCDKIIHNLIISGADSVSGNDISVQGESSIHEIETDISHVGNPDDWLALRVQGGRSWKLSSCFSPEACEG